MNAPFTAARPVVQQSSTASLVWAGNPRGTRDALATAVRARLAVGLLMATMPACDCGGERAALSDASTETPDAAPDAATCAPESLCDRFCCTDEEDCLGARCAPRAPCETADDCDDDTRCVESWCVPWPQGESDPECSLGEGAPPGAFAPVLQCEWTGGLVSVPPLVVDLDGRGAPEIVVVAMETMYVDTPSWVVAIDGATCEEVWRTDAGHFDGLTPIAAGDLDGDGRIEIAAKSRLPPDYQQGGLVLLDDEGEVLCESEPLGYAMFPAAIANLDGAGDAEILLGLVALDSSCNVIWNQSCEAHADEWGVADCAAQFGETPVVADLDGDGAPEVVTGNRIFDGATGEVEQETGRDDGPVAVADFDPSTPEPEIAVHGPAGLRIQRVTGDVIFGPNDVLETFVTETPGGAPTVADYDGDGFVEIAASGRLTWAVFDPDCEPDWTRGGECAGGDGLLWERDIGDRSSGAVASTAFDLDGDGAFEAMTADECFLRIVDGRTGEARFVAPFGNGTGFEYPTVADADGDGAAEVVVGGWGTFAPCGAEDPETGTAFVETNPGVRVYSDADDAWMPARRVWNQHAYSVTNVEEDGAIPDSPVPSWRAENTVRVNERLERTAPLPAADLTVRGMSWDDGCPDAIVLRAVVANRGARDAAAGARVTFVDPDGAVLCETATTHALLPGEEEAVACDWFTPGVPVDVVVHVETISRECAEENGDATIPDVGCAGVE